MIKSIGYSQEEIIKDILNLHCKSKNIDADITYSKGGFYKSGLLKQPDFKFDKFPQTKDTVKIDDRILLDDNSVSIVICDLPFVISTGPSLKTKEQGRNMTHERFSSYKNPKELFDSYRLWINESFRVLKDKGVLIFKCQDTVSSGKNYFIHIFAFNAAIKAGFYPKDMAVLLSKSRLISGKIKKQMHMRKFHSYFWVFSKEKNKIDNIFV